MAFHFLQRASAQLTAHMYGHGVKRKLYPKLGLYSFSCAPKLFPAGLDSDAIFCDWLCPQLPVTLLRAQPIVCEKSFGARGEYYDQTPRVTDRGFPAENIDS